MRLLQVSSIKYCVSGITIYNLLLATCYLLLVSGCKKDKKSNPPPVITINLPTSGQSVTYSLDPTLKTYTATINVNAQVSDNEHLAYITVTLVDGNYVPQQASVNVPIASADFVFNINYEVTQFRLASGTYNIQITANDGSNTTVGYQPIYINTSPTEFWGFCAVLKSAPQTINEYDSLPSSTSPTQPPFYSISLNQPYNGMKYGGYNAQLYVNGNGTQMSFQSFNMHQQAMGSLNYSESASPTQQNYTCLYTDGNKPYVGFASGGNINSYQNSGSPSTSYIYPTTTAYPYCFTTSTSYGVAVYRNTYSSPNDAIVAFPLAGVYVSPNFPVYLAGNTNLNSVLAMFEKANDSLYVLGNDASNNAVAYLLYPSIPAFTPIPMPSGKMLSATKVNNGGFIFSTTTGVYACNGVTVNPLPLFLPLGAQKLYYQPGLSMLTIASSSSTGSSLVSYAVGSSTTFTLIPNRTLTFGDSLIDFEVITNK
jgi:hypothetical protein